MERQLQESETGKTTYPPTDSIFLFLDFTGFTGFDWILLVSIGFCYYFIFLLPVVALS
jgi:hypothetical protein